MSLIRLVSRVLGMFIMGVTWVAAILIGLYVLFESFNIVAYIFGDIIAFLSLIIAPVMIAIAPWFLLFKTGDWSLVILTYGTIPAIWISMFISGALMVFGDSDE